MRESTFRLNAGLLTPMVLADAILIYRGGAQTFATIHGITPSDSGAVIGTGRALSKRRAQSLARALAAAPALKPPAIIPKGLLYADEQTLLWWRPRGRRMVRFACADLGDIQTAVTPHPALVFRANADTLSVWALRGPARPHGGTRLYQAPYWNVYDSGRICTGDVTLPQDLSPQAIAAWETVFFDSDFTHPNTSELIVYPGGTFQFWRTMLAGGLARFPAGSLIKLRRTVGALLPVASDE